MIYKKNENMYELYIGEKKIFETEEISFLYDLETYTLLQHGEPIKVAEYWQYVQGKSKELAKTMAILTGCFDIEDVNQIISCSGYIERVIKDIRKKINEGKVNES